MNARDARFTVFKRTITVTKNSLLCFNDRNKFFCSTIDILHKRLLFSISLYQLTLKRYQGFRRDNLLNFLIKKFE
jgi:hypothetical protein